MKALETVKCLLNTEQFPASWTHDKSLNGHQVVPG